MLDGFDSSMYGYILVSALSELLPASGIEPSKANIGIYGGLLFSIFLVKPSPFCLLDEVDAPLDDANIGRFNALLREMSKRSQFIIITHNKRTMELNDKLYGVTMEDAGVSKMVSIQLTSGAHA